MKDNYINNLFNMISLNLKIFIKFEILYKLILSIVFTPIVMSIFNILLNLAGFSVININNLIQIITNPLILMFLIIVLLFFIVTSLFEISTIIVILDLSYHNKKLTLKESIKISILKFKNLLKKKNIPIVGYLLLITPILNISIISNSFALIKVPDSIINFITLNPEIIFIVLFAYLLLVALLSDKLFAIHYMIIEDLDIKKAIEKSDKLIKEKAFKDHVKIILTQIVFAATIVGFITIGVFILPAIYEALANIMLISRYISLIIIVFTIIFFIIAATISNGLSLASISYMFYSHKKEKKERIVKMKYDDSYSTFFIKKLVRCTIGILLIIVGVLSFFDQNTLVIEKKTNVTPKSEKKIEVTAHRGASVLYPENTISAFKGAVDQKADWIELDVQQTSDGYLVISHDLNLGRTTGVYENVSDLTLEEIKELDAGWLYGERFIGETIPTLEEAIEFAKENSINLCIELKVYGSENEFEKHVLDVIKEYEFEDNCIIASGSLESLEKVKKIDKKIKTVAILAATVYEIRDLECADVYSIDAEYIDQALVDRIHDEKKEVFAWTINTEEKINEMINLGVDNIITDDVSLAKVLVAEREMNIITIKPKEEN